MRLHPIVILYAGAVENAVCCLYLLQPSSGTAPAASPRFASLFGCKFAPTLPLSLELPQPRELE